METAEVKQEAAPASTLPAKPQKAKLKAPRKKRKWIRNLIVLVVIVALVVVLLSQCMSAGTQIMAGAYLPETAQVQELTVAVSGTGTIEPIHSYKVTTLMSGEVLEAPFEEGQTIGKGDLLFRIDSKDVESNIKQLEISLRQAQLTYDDLIKRQNDNQKNLNIKAEADGVVIKRYVDPGDTVTVGTLIADILDRDRMKLELPFHTADAAGFWLGQSATVVVDGTAERIQGTVDSIAATDEVGAGGTLVRKVTILVDNPGALSETSGGTAVISEAACSAGAQFTYAAQKQIVSKASGDLETLNIKEGDRVSDGQIVGVVEAPDVQTQIDGAKLSIENAQLSIQNARDRLEDYTITSTITGTVIEKNFDVGDTIGGSSTSATTGITYPAVIYDLSDLTFDMKIDELDINKIKVGQTVEITSDALDGESFSGHVDKININGVTAGGVTTYPVTILVDDATEELKPGMNVSAKILVEKAGNVLCIPVDAVSRGNLVKVALPGCLDETGKVVNIAATEDREITLGRNDEDYIEVLSGLEDGDVVLVENSSSNMMAMMMGGG